LGGRGYHITGDHLVTLPNLYRQVMRQFTPRAPLSQNSAGPTAGIDSGSDFAQRAPAAAASLAKTLAGAPALAPIRENLMRAYTVLERCFRTGGTLFLAANSSSLRDALQSKLRSAPSNRNRRRIPAQHWQRMLALPGGSELTQNIQVGLRAILLGADLAAAAAVEPALSRSDFGTAQALYALARSGDVFLGISGGENNQDLEHAASVAQLLGLTSIVIADAAGASLAQQADIFIEAPAQASNTDLVWQVRLTQCLYAMLEDQLLGEEILP
jgi:D-sedoheptulose 7-phosphate isomerase